MKCEGVESRKLQRMNVKTVVINSAGQQKKKIYNTQFVMRPNKNLTKR